MTSRTQTAALTAASRIGAVAAVVALIGMLPWLSGRSAEYTILRARYADREATPEALAAVRAELGLDRGPLPIFGDWLSGILQGDAGNSWITNTPVLPGTLSALGVSLTLMGFAVVCALTIALALCIPAIRAGVRGEPRRESGALAAAFTALPEFLLAAILLIIGSIWLGWFPPYGWNSINNAVLPALALGIPGGGLIGRLTSEALTAAFQEDWVRTWRMAQFPRHTIAFAAFRRALPSVISQIGLVIIGITGGAVAVEQVFAIPGLGRATLGAAAAQDIPTLQAGILALLVIAVVVGVLAAGIRALLLGPALRLNTVPAVPIPHRTTRRDLIAPVAAASVLILITSVGLFRNPYLSTYSRLQPPSWALPFGADASGRDLLARVAHGTLTTVGTALAVVGVCLIIGLLVGLVPRLSTGFIEVTNAAPPIIAGLIVAAISGPSTIGAAIAVALVSWAPLAAHTAALISETRAQPHIAVLPTLGVGRARTLWAYLLPSVLPTVLRHAMLRLPGIALALAALGFLGLGPQQPTPEWGLILAEGIDYVERGPWAVLAPASALVAVSVLAVSLSGLSIRRRSTRNSVSDAVNASAP
ncbi:ABC transporter permease subunit [Jonesia quinghaiensis]|uniref:ABC transporter permease subunit n=1 Tax=Jonesia quinghaiensis TaxID=262806 RepID=UPI00040D0F51|nr:ABC transporter permease subunit [Jonesia quinghaiensis]